MAFAFDEIFAYGGQLIVAAKKRVPKALGIGEEKIDHSAYIEGNTPVSYTHLTLPTTPYV